MSVTPKHFPLPSALSQREQAKEKIKGLIKRGKISRKGYLPSIRKTADLIGLNRDAVWRAYSDLEKEGLIVSTSNRRYEIHPEVKESHLRVLDIRLIAVGKGSIRFSGLQRFYQTLSENEKLYSIRIHLECALNVNEFKPEWFKGIDGVILGGYFEGSDAEKSLPDGLPCIGVITSLSREPDISIDTDNQLAGEIAANRLIENGVERPCLIAYADPDTRHTLRKLGFQSKWVESGRSIEAITEHWIDPNNTFQRVIELEKASRELRECDGVFCLEKESAIDLVNILEHNGIGVPETLKLITMDGTFEGLQTNPQLTYIRQSFEEMASIAAEKMRILTSSSFSHAADSQSGKVLVAPRLVVRESA